MELKEILDLLKSAVREQGFDTLDIFMNLFGDFTYTKKGKLQAYYTLDKDASPRRICGGSMALKDALFQNLCTSYGYEDLVFSIGTNYIPILPDTAWLYRELTSRIASSRELPDKHKQRLLDIFCQTENLSEYLPFLIGACLIIGNYHTSRRLTLNSLKDTSQPNETYGLNLNFISLDASALKYEIWKGARSAYLHSREKNDCLGSSGIVACLLPKGHIVQKAPEPCHEPLDGTSKNLDDICGFVENHFSCSNIKNIAITGECGIGKTTFFRHIQERFFGKPQNHLYEYNPGHMIPVFINLNRCPVDISDWYEDKYKKTNFITRYIASLVQSTTLYQNWKKEEISLAHSIEQEFQHTPVLHGPSYLLLLDGFNEVTTKPARNGESVRAILSHEIHQLQKLPNIRIITASRPTQDDHFTKDFTKVYLTGLSTSDIQSYLETRKNNAFSSSRIKQILSDQNLVKCLQFPLLLRIFASEKAPGAYAPKTPGELLYCFFHENESIYSLSRHLEESLNNPLKEIPYATELILDFVMPYIGWFCETKDILSLDRSGFSSCIDQAFLEIDELLTSVSTFPFDDFKENLENARNALHALVYLKQHSSGLQAILSCTQDYLGILYEYRSSTYSDGNRYRYYFAHCCFRGYFSAVWMIQHLKLLPYRF